MYIHEHLYKATYYSRYEESNLRTWDNQLTRATRNRTYKPETTNLLALRGIEPTNLRQPTKHATSTLQSNLNIDINLHFINQTYIEYKQVYIQFLE